MRKGGGVRAKKNHVAVCCLGVAVPNSPPRAEILSVFLHAALNCTCRMSRHFGLKPTSVCHRPFPEMVNQRLVAALAPDVKGRSFCMNYDAQKGTDRSMVKCWMPLANRVQKEWRLRKHLT
jgi:hypothetical protein